MRDPKERLRDIVEAITAIERYRHHDKAAFEQDELLQNWYVRHLQIIGEAARALPEEVRSLAPDIPWSKIVGMRSVLVHWDFEVDTDLVWETVCRDVSALKPAIERLLQELEKRRC